MCQTFQAMGIGCAATNYRLAPGHKWPAQPMDVAAAFGWLKNNIAKRGGDPRRIFLFGHSSGCLLVSMVAADSTYLATQRLTPHDVAGVIAMGCRLDDVVTVTSTPPAAYESSSVPPDRVDAFMKEEEAFTSLSQRNDAVPASHITAGLPRRWCSSPRANASFRLSCGMVPSSGGAPRHSMSTPTSPSFQGAPIARRFRK